ncbi:MAG: amino acid permease [Nitrososphaeria archaeon]|nr:amino acid permease [Nitrososphaeria archaeon]NIN53389.1 amino acid permease [Nitrososphaeria archaeon]NIQ33901.1 amino acid permease [Nitrososphaeria archaeon]
MTEEKVPLFVREATGLVREVGMISFIAIAMSYAIGGGINRLAVVTGGQNPGANVALSFLLAGIPILLSSIIGGMLLSGMPRSGGAYVFISRILSPPIAFMLSFGVWVGLGMALGLIANWDVYFLGQLLANAGTALKDPGLMSLAVTLQADINRLIIGTLIVIIVTGIAITRMSIVVKVIDTIWVIPLIGSILTMAVFLPYMGASMSTLQSVWDGTFGVGAFDEILTVAKGAGWTAEEYTTFSMGATITAMFAAMFAYGSPSVGCASSVAGEVKTPRKTLLWGPIIAMLIVMFVYIMYPFMVYGAWDPFIRAYTFVNINPELAGQLTITPPLQPLMPLFASILTNPALGIFLSLTAFIWLFNDLLPFFLGATRMMFAWSFDRAFPTKFAEVSERFHSPIYASLALFVVAEFTCIIMSGFLLYELMPQFDIIMIHLIIGFDGALAVSATLYPFTRKDIYDRSPVKPEVGGVPLISVLGAITTGLMLWLYWIMWGQLAPNGVLTSSAYYGIFVYTVGLIIFTVMASRAVKKGIPLSSIYSEIPPE